jgi:hypothetical protein
MEKMFDAHYDKLYDYSHPKFSTADSLVEGLQKQGCDESANSSVPTPALV